MIKLILAAALILAGVFAYQHSAVIAPLAKADAHTLVVKAKTDARVIKAEKDARGAVANVLAKAAEGVRK